MTYQVHHLFAWCQVRHKQKITSFLKSMSFRPFFLPSVTGTFLVMDSLNTHFGVLKTRHNTTVYHRKSVVNVI
jgi:hypothetical protein